MGRVWLGFTDSETLSLTPRYYKSQVLVHTEMNKPSDSSSGTPTDYGDDEPTGFIDQIPGM